MIIPQELRAFHHPNIYIWMNPLKNGFLVLLICLWINISVIYNMNDIKKFWWHINWDMVTIQIIITVILQGIKNYMNICKCLPNNCWYLIHEIIHKINNYLSIRNLFLKRSWYIITGILHRINNFLGIWDCIMINSWYLTTRLI